MFGIQFTRSRFINTKASELSSFSILNKLNYLKFTYLKIVLPYDNNSANRVSTMNSPTVEACSDPSLLKPPTVVRGMKSLNRELFKKDIFVPTVEIDLSKIPNPRLVSKKSVLKKYFLKFTNFKPMQDDTNSSLCEGQASNEALLLKKKVYLNPLLIKSYNDFEECDIPELTSLGVTPQSLKFTSFTVTYANWRPDEILKAILPEESDNVTSFSQIGHIIHLNLREHVQEYKQVIAEVLLDKVSGAKTIVNKVDTISSTYRNFQMEVIGGKNDLMAQVKENFCTYDFDFSTVYWNPRLCTEHERIVKKLNEGDILYDVFAGVGPFSVPAGRKKCIVLANDLNPESYKWLQHNAKLNKVLPFVKAFNKDGENFIKEDVKYDLLERWKSGSHANKSIHITMNLPALAETFLHVFNGLFVSEEINEEEISILPIVHLYCFVKGEGDLSKLALQQVEENLDSKLNEADVLEIIQVRNVSPNKGMMRVSFTLPPCILIANQNSKNKLTTKECLGSPPPKKICLEGEIESSHGKTEKRELTEQEKLFKEQA